MLDKTNSYTYSFGATLNVPAPNRGCFTLSPAFKFDTARDAVDYADAVTKQTGLECVPTATRSQGNGNYFQCVIYKVIVVHKNGFTPDKIDFWHCPMQIISAEQFDAMTDAERSEFRTKHGAAFYTHI